MSTSSSASLPGGDQAVAATFRAGLFAGRTMLVTGGTSGIGAAVAAAAVGAGATVVATGATEAEVATAAAEPRFAGATLRPLDVRDEAAIAALVAALRRLDVLVNCAGIIRRGSELEPQAFAEVVDVNLTGTLRMCAAARAHLAAAQGTIVNVASMLSFIGSAVAPAYAASKGGIAQLTKSLALAFAPDGIRVNAIAPGWIETPLTASVRADPARHAAIAQRTALKRWAAPEELVGAVFFLCSPAAAYITGTILPVDGGFLAG